MTSKILFKDVIRACRDHAFRNSHYPVVLSFEQHCSDKQKARIGSILTEILGDMLLRLPADGLESARMPSPEEAKYKFLIKAKYALSKPGTDTNSSAADGDPGSEDGDRVSEDGNSYNGDSTGRSSYYHPSDRSYPSSSTSKRSGVKRFLRGFTNLSRNAAPVDLSEYNGNIFLVAQKMKP